eukprot:12720449-Alexandrium_andersonii.AAC.2
MSPTSRARCLSGSQRYASASRTPIRRPPVQHDLIQGGPTSLSTAMIIARRSAAKSIKRKCCSKGEQGTGATEARTEKSGRGATSTRNACPH